MPTYLDKIRGERGLLQEEQRARRRANDAILWWTRRRANESLDDDNDVRETVRHTTVEIQALFSTWMSQPGVESRRRLRAAVRADQRYLRTLATV